LFDQVRNLVGSPLAGIDVEDVDTRPYASRSRFFFYGLDAIY
jgi:hypothetical protein